MNDPAYTRIPVCTDNDQNSNLFYCSDDSSLYRNDITKMICDKFGAETKHRKNGNVFIFNPDYLIKMGKIYAKTNTIYTKLIGDAVDAGDAVLGRSEAIDVSITADIPEQNSAKSEIKEIPPLPQSASPESPESPISDSADKSNFDYDCYECIRRKKKRFRTNDQSEYQRHWTESRHKGTCYPGKADLELYGLSPQDKEWEK
jgi:hypothetical protein